MTSAKSATARKREAAAIAAAILLLERRAKHGLRSALATAVAIHHATPVHVEAMLSVVGYAAIMRIREGARISSRSAWAKSTDLTTAQPIEPWIEAPRAQRSAGALARAWREESIAIATKDAQARQSGTQALSGIGWRIDRTATTEVVHAWAQEVDRQNEFAASRGFVVVETYNALLDACDRCEELDGTTATRPNRLADDPPLHPRCRCFVTTEIEWPEAIAS